MKLTGNGWGLNARWLRSRPSWLRYTFTDSDRQLCEVGTLRLGFAQIKWLRRLANPTGPT